MCRGRKVSGFRGFRVFRGVLGGPFDLVSRVSKVGYGGL